MRPCSVEPCCRPLVLAYQPKPLINQLIEADRQRRVIDPPPMQPPGPLPPPAFIEPTHPPKFQPKPCPSLPPKAAPPPPPVEQVRYVPLYHLGSLMDRFA